MATTSSQGTTYTPKGLDASIDIRHIGPAYTDSITKLSITVPGNRSWKEGKKWPQNDSPQQKLGTSPARVWKTILAKNGVLGETEANQLHKDLESIVSIIWGSWKDLNAALEARHVRNDDLHKSLLSHLWSLWKDPAGFPDDDCLKKWFERFIAFRVSKMKNKVKGRLGQTNKRATKASNYDIYAAFPSRSVASKIGPQELQGLRSMSIVVFRSPDADEAQGSPSGKTTWTIALNTLDLGSDHLDSAADALLNSLKSHPVNLDRQTEYVTLLNGMGGIHFNLSGTKKKVRLLEALREEQLCNKTSLYIQINRRLPSFSQTRDLSDSESEDTDEEGTQTESAKITMRHLNELWIDPEKLEQGCVILLNGLSGTDKHNIAEAMKNNLPKQTTRIISEDPIVQAAEAVFPEYDDGLMELRGRLRGVMFETLTDQMLKQRVVKAIMIECLLDDDRDVQLLAEYVRIAHDADVPFYLINLKCKLEEQERRVGDFPRAERSQHQPQAAGFLRQLADSRLVDLNNLPGELLDEVHVEHYELNTSGLTIDHILSKEMRNMDE